MRIQSYMCAFVGLALSSFSDRTLACGDTTDCAPLKTVRCPSNILDISFVLDRSGSMKRGLCKKSSKKHCTAVLCKNDYLATYDPKISCRRQDIMRFVIRDVLKELFMVYQRGCLEYMETEDSRKYGDCTKRGFTTTRFHIQWWSNQADEGYLNEQFTPFPPANSSEYIGKSFRNYFYFSDGSRNPEKWNESNVLAPTMKDDSIDDFFKNVLLKGNTNTRKSGDESNDVDPWPHARDWTWLYTGLESIYGTLDAAFKSYTSVQQAQARFPVFVMTDGAVADRKKYVHGRKLTPKWVKDRLTNWAKKLEGLTGTASQVDIYGLGLTGVADKRLKKKQKRLYDDLGFTDEVTVPTTSGMETIPMYFNDEVTAKKVVSALFNSVNEGCEECYELGGVTKCVGMGQPIPSFVTSISTTNDIIEPNNRPDGTLAVEIAETTLGFDTYVGIENDIFNIPQNTTLCHSYYRDVNGNPGISFRDYDKGGKCGCCKALRDSSRLSLNQSCFCDFSSETVIETKTITLGSGDDEFDAEITFFDKGLPVFEELESISELKITDKLSTLGVPIDDENEDEGDLANVGFGVDNDGVNDGNDVVFTPVPDRDDDLETITQGGATRTVSLIGLMALPMMAAFA